MIQGIIYNNRPFVPLIIGWRLGVQEILALLDTGFTGEIKVPPEKVSELGLEITHTEKVSLADGSQMNMPVSLAVVSMEGATNIVSVLISKGPSIVGVGLFKRFGYTLNIDFKDDVLTLQRK